MSEDAERSAALKRYDALIEAADDLPKKQREVLEDLAIEIIECGNMSVAVGLLLEFAKKQRKRKK